VTWPSSLARHGTIAGTQVRVRAVRGPSFAGLNSALAAASSRVGQRVGGIGCTRLRAWLGSEDTERSVPLTSRAGRGR
jgi:hypothetical protein